MRAAIFWWALTFVLSLLVDPSKHDAPVFLVVFHISLSFGIAHNYFCRVRDEGRRWLGIRTTFRTGTIWHKMGDIL